MAKRSRTIWIAILALALTGHIFADSVTYRQIQQPQDPARPGTQPAKAEESQTHPPFVRLPDGRIVPYGPGIICEDDCVEPLTPTAFRSPAPRLWFIVPPLLAGGILCAVLCGSGDEGPEPTPTINLPPASPTPLPTTPPPAEIPEPGTMALVGLGLGAMLLRRRRKNINAKKHKDSETGLKA